jgi:dipeptidyl aminopeptidase/acylaminoacyl peptidase
MIVPAANLPWLVLLVLAALVYLLVFRRIAPAQPLGARRLLWPAALVPPIVALLVVGLAHGETEHVTPIGSADGIAFAYAPEDASHIFVTRGGELVQITDSDGSELAPGWSPDHTRIAFQSNRDGNWEVYVANADGTDVRRLTDDDAEDGEPGWAADGQHILFVRDGDLYEMRIDGGPLRKLADDPHWPRPALSPDAVLTQCLDRGYWHICSGGRSITHGPYDDFAPAWSPDGKRIAFISDRDGPDQLFVMRADGTGAVRITSGQGDKDTPAWR